MVLVWAVENIYWNLVENLPICYLLGWQGGGLVPGLCLDVHSTSPHAGVDPSLLVSLSLSALRSV